MARWHTRGRHRCETCRGWSYLFIHSNRGRKEWRYRTISISLFLLRCSSAVWLAEEDIKRFIYPSWCASGSTRHICFSLWSHHPDTGVFCRNSRSVSFTFRYFIADGTQRRGKNHGSCSIRYSRKQPTSICAECKRTYYSPRREKVEGRRQTHPRLLSDRYYVVICKSQKGRAGKGSGCSC